jgi:hypothetical protein
LASACFARAPSLLLRLAPLVMSALRCEALLASVCGLYQSITNRPPSRARREPSDLSSKALAKEKAPPRNGLGAKEGPIRNPKSQIPNPKSLTFPPSLTPKPLTHPFFPLSDFRFSKFQRSLDHSRLNRSIPFLPLRRRDRGNSFPLFAFRFCVYPSPVTRYPPPIHGG